MISTTFNIGWMGTGIMGKHMAGHLIKHGHKISVFNRTKSKTDDLVAKGATYATPEEIAKNCNVIFMMLGYPQDVKDIVYGDKGILNLVQPGSIIIDHTTSSPQLAEQLYEDFKKKEVSFLDIPVSGGDVIAEKGEVNALAGGDKEIFEKIVPLLKCYSKQTNHFGPAGKGLQAKLYSQICLAINLAGVIEALMFGMKTGLDPEQLFNVLKESGASSYAMNIYMPRILKGDLEPSITVELFVKDLEMILEESKRFHIVLPIITQLRQFYEALMADGGAKKGFQALILTLAKLNGIEKDIKDNKPL